MKDRSREKRKRVGYIFCRAENDRKRTVSLAQWVMRTLKSHKERQAEQRLRGGAAWEDSGLVFTNEIGHHLRHATAAVTLDVYARATEQMKEDSAARMEVYIEKVLGLK